MTRDSALNQTPVCRIAAEARVENRGRQTRSRAVDIHAPASNVGL
jgi:hypothetical protein